MTILPGKRLGPYEILSAIGADGIGEAHQADNTKLGRDVAINVLPEAVAHNPHRLSRFQRETKTLASLNHPHIGTIHGLEESNGTHYLVMELVSGETLREQIAREGALRAQPFDLDRRQSNGVMFTVVEQVGGDVKTDTAAFTTSPSGGLAYWSEVSSRIGSSFGVLDRGNRSAPPLKTQNQK